MTSRTDASSDASPPPKPGWRPEGDRILLILVTILLAVAMTILLKATVPIDRPCYFEGIPNPLCPEDTAYPSQHTSAAFSLVFPLFGHPLFLLAYPFAIAVGYERIVVGVHTWPDIAGGIATAGFAYAVAEWLLIPSPGRTGRVGKPEGGELGRQFLHAGMGVLISIGILVMGIAMTTMYTLAGTVIGLFIVHLKAAGRTVPIIDQLLLRYERDGVLPGKGSLYYAIGILFALGLLRDDPPAAIAVILILAIGDGLATIVGSSVGRHRLPWNRSKSVEGSIGFAIGAASSLLVLPSLATIAACIAAVVLESLKIELDDNITLPVVTSLVLFFMH